MGAGLYVHFPFCAAKCPYCHFYSVPWSADGARAWREGLAREASAAAAGGVRFDTLYLGGGTPSLLDPGELAAVVGGLRKSLDLDPLELTVEVNPSGGRTGFLQGWRDAGVTRLSVGVQSFDDGVLRTLGRDYSAAEALRFCRAAREAGFDALAVDLMIGVPGETALAIERTLASLLEIDPDHVSAYFLESVEGLPFAEVLERRPVDDDAAVDNFARIGDALAEGGLPRYEISNFARRGKECRHNLKYWRYEPFLGLGPSASSHMEDRRWTNRPSMEEWAEGVRARGSARGDVVELDARTAAREALVFGLRLVEGVDRAALRERTGADAFALYAGEIEELAGEGLLARAGDRLWIPPDKLLVSNAILSHFLNG